MIDEDDCGAIYGKKLIKNPVREHAEVQIIARAINFASEFHLHVRCFCTVSTSLNNWL
jgi:hypothetical protein